MILNGADQLAELGSLLAGKRLGLITSVSGTNNQMISTSELLAEKYNVVALFAPEHGIRGELPAGDIVEDYIDSLTGVPVHSLYRKDSKGFTEEMLQELDTLVYDIGDVGTRFYTYLSTLHNTIRDCAKWDKELIVLDRINPLGDKVEGNILEKEFSSFVGTYPMPIRHGLTPGEFATMVSKEEKTACNLTVVPVKGWKRDMLFSETGNLWVIPSLNIPTFETALAYPGSCFFEGTNCTEGRGTTVPFLYVGAPYIDAVRLAHHINAQGLKGVLFAPFYFTPNTSKHQGVLCHGVKYYITDYHTFEPVKAGLTLLYAIKELHPEEFEFLPPVKETGKQFIQLLGGGSDLLNHMPLEKLLAKYETESQAFAEHKKQYHLYQ